MNWDEQSKAVSGAIEALFNEHPEYFRPEDVVRCSCDDPEHDHDDPDPNGFIIVGAVLAIQQRNLDGHEMTCVFNWPPDMGRVQKIGLVELSRDRLR